MGIVGLAEGMLQAHTQDYILIYTGKDGEVGMSSSARTWSIGAVERARIMLAEHEKREARGDG